MVQNSREQRGRESQKAIFFFEGLSGRVESEKRRDKRREEECGGVKSVYLSKESDSRLPANNPFLLLHFSPTPQPLPLILSFTLFPSLSPRACFQKRPCQFTVTLHHLFSLSSFSFFISLHFLSQSNIHGLLQASLSFALLSLSNILSCFLPTLSRHFILTFQN